MQTKFYRAVILTSTKNPWIREIRSLHQAKGRREQQLFLLEGTHLLQEALAAHWPLAAICSTSEWLERHQEMGELFSIGIRQQLVSPEVLAAIATTENPDGVVAVAHRRDPDPDLSHFTLGIAVETLQDPGNLGSLVRTAVAAGGDGVWLTADSVDPDHPKVLRASAGQWFHLPPQVLTDPLTRIRACQDRGVQVLAAVAGGTRFWDLDLRNPTLFLLGNEGAGLSQDWIDAADVRVGIPMAQAVESLNVSMTGGLLLYEAGRQRV